MLGGKEGGVLPSVCPAGKQQKQPIQRTCPPPCQLLLSTSMSKQSPAPFWDISCCPTNSMYRTCRQRQSVVRAQLRGSSTAREHFQADFVKETWHSGCQAAQSPGLYPLSKDKQNGWHQETGMTIYTEHTALSIIFFGS